MANPTSNFGWQMPTPTDLVTDLPADFEVFGQAVDTSMADLKGGTSGQVLSKNSNTDMDFVWVTSDDANAIQNSIVNAKGDIIGASANDTPAITSVGANFAWLRADSSTSSGLAWDDTGWTAWTPTVTSNAGSFTTVSATGFYKRIGKTCFVQTTITITTNGTASGTVNTNLPFTAVGTQQTGVFREDQSIGFLGQILVSGGNAVYRKADNTYPGGNNYKFFGSFFYEVA